MEKLIEEILNSPVSNLLIIAGLAFLALAIIGNISGKIQTGKNGRIASGFLGTILLVLGLVFYLHGPNSNLGSPTPTTAPVTSEAAIPVLQATTAIPTAIPPTVGPSTVSGPTVPPPTNTSAVPGTGGARVLIPAGVFTMGSNSGDTMEQPVHTVNVSAFYMDKYEVTNALYKACVDAGSCTFPTNPSSATRTSYYGNPQFDNYPVVYVTWTMAESYCAWRGGRLPTEAEWEKAARGQDGRTYPWGEGASCSEANYAGCSSDTVKAGCFEAGKSPLGIYDMAGNVWEWVSDFYQANYYSIEGNSATDPIGPDNGDTRVLRGGSYMNMVKSLRTTLRNFSDPSKSYNYVGFRCASSNP
jgi:formylglycine-generating enzyme required for sulfatase activity